MMNHDLVMIEKIMARKGYTISFQQKIAGAVVCTATRENDTRQVLARTVSEGVDEIARILGLKSSGWQISS